MGALMRANLSDESLVARALRAGWSWEDGTTQWPGSPKHPATGWREAPNRFLHTKPEDMADRLRGRLGNVGDHLGFDHALDCSDCGLPVWLAYSIDDALIRHRECFSCHHWLSLIRSDGGLVIEDPDGRRRHYMLGKKTKPHSWNGFAGQWFTIRKAGGEIVKTCDLWTQGEIPERFHDRLPVNAEFIE